MRNRTWNVLAVLLAPLGVTTWCSVCSVWWDPADSQGDWNHHH